MDALAAYIPRIAAEWERESPGVRWRELDATCCFVDISGFTALSERLARRGRIGAEELTEVLNHVFGRMLGIAYDKGGSLLKFGGDALLLLFSGDEHAVLGAEAAVAMRAALREARTLPTSVGRLNLRMSTGIHSGTFNFFHVGDSHRELLIGGPAASTTTRMEHGADAGEIVVSEATAARLPNRACGNPKGDGLLLKWRKVVDGGPGPALIHEPDAATLEHAVPVALRAHLRHAGGESEHRMASVAFVKFTGVDDYLAEHGPEATADALDEVVTTVQQAADAESVTFLASDIDENGGKIILTAGVPIAREDDEGRVLRAALQIVAQPLALPVRIGVNRGHVFAGDIGTAFRRTFTVMGDTVNLAARLMAAAQPRSVYATAEVLERARTLFEIEALEPFFVKGKSQPVQAYAVKHAVGVKEAGSGSLPFLGRDKEMATLLDAEARAREGHGSVIVIEAERGAGKTRLVEEFRQASQTGAVLVLQGEAYGRAVPYLPLREPLRGLLGVTETDRAEAGTQVLETMRSLVPDRVALAPLLAPLLDIEVAPTPESAAIAEEFIRDRIADLLVALLVSAAGTALTIIAEDSHWFDDATARICDRFCIAAREHAWLLCAARRRTGVGFHPKQPDAVIVLESLDEGVAHELIIAATQNQPLRPQDRDRIVARGDGNPLFLEELLRVAHDSDTDIDSLPDSLDAVAMREIDALPPIARRVVRLASVLGPAFDRALLEQVLAAESVELDVVTLEHLEHHLSADGEQRLRFRHALFQEAAYESLPFRTRLGLHRRAGEAIEHRAGDDVDDVAPLLSLHFLEAQDWQRTWDYARRAARLARAAHAPGEVATHLERAITASRRLPDTAPDDVAVLLTELGEARMTLGVYDRADDAYRRAALLRIDPLERARIAERRSYVRGEHQGRLTAAIRQVRAGFALLDAVPGSTTDADRVRAQLLAREADLRYRQGRLKESAKLCGEAMLEAERAGDRRAQAVAMSVLDSCLVEMGVPGAATHLHNALELYEELDDQLYVAVTLGNLGGVSFFQSKWAQAADYYERAVEAANKAGDLGTAAIAHSNLGELRVNQGRVAEAEALLVPAVRTLESFEYLVAAAAGMLSLGRARAFLGRHEDGVAMLRAAAAVFDDAQVLIGSIEARARVAEVSAVAGETELGTASLDEARELERALGDTPLTALLDRVEVTLAVVSGDVPRARAHLEDSLPRARGLSAKYELMLLIALAQRIEIADAELTREQEELVAELGVVDLVALAGSRKA
jgi:class 3 adenylate cyclase/tetratricopeptide (TPR) repeat protein